jgi:hypothetical protein
MTYNGIVQNGVIVLDEGRALAEGTVVRVQPANDSDAGDGAGVENDALTSRLLDLAGTCEGLADLALNHDHYLYGRPKQ